MTPLVRESFQFPKIINVTTPRTGAEGLLKRSSIKDIRGCVAPPRRFWYPILERASETGFSGRNPIVSRCAMPGRTKCGGFYCSLSALNIIKSVYQLSVNLYLYRVYTMDPNSRRSSVPWRNVEILFLYVPMISLGIEQRLYKVYESTERRVAKTRSQNSYVKFSFILCEKIVPETRKRRT